MSEPVGRNLPLSLARRVVTDLMHFSQKVPTVVAERRMNLAPVIAARRACASRPSWCAIFTKAFAKVAARRQELRQTYMKFPWPHLYEHPTNIAAVTVERRIGNEDVVFCMQLRHPDQCSLTELEARLGRCKEEPVQHIAACRRALRLGKLPWPWRRLAWWLLLNVFGRLRSRCIGTFGFTSTAAHGAGMLYILSILTAALHYSLFDDQGNLDVRLTFDHRVLDGASAARALADLEHVLKTDILEELERMRMVQAA